MIEQKKKGTLTRTDWHTVVNTMCDAFKLTAAEKRNFYKNKTAQLIAAIPFIAGCRQPMRNNFV